MTEAEQVALIAVALTAGLDFPAARALVNDAVERDRGRPLVETAELIHDRAYREARPDAFTA